MKKWKATMLGITEADPVLRDAANRWTDNCFMLQKFLVETGGMEPKQVDKLLGIDDKFDFVE